jgi:UDP-glucose 4-epimerase
MILKNRSILITGGAGFIGSHLLDRLMEENEVTVLDDLRSGKMEHISHHLENPNFKLIKGDILDQRTLDAAVSGNDMVFHLAANPDVKVGATDTKTHLDQNVLATYAVLESMRKNGVKRLAFTSTSTIYGEADQVPTPEDYGPLKPISLYGASKLACEALISSYCHTFDMQSWLFRFANIVGERGTHGVIVDFINKLKADPSVLEILGSGEQRKSYLEVRDCVEGMICSVERSYDQVNIFNVGSDDWVDVTGIADIVVEAMGLEGVKYRYTGGEGGRGWKGDVKVMLLSIDAIRALGWEPRYGSAQSIQMAARSILRSLSSTKL